MADGRRRWLPTLPTSWRSPSIPRSNRTPLLFGVAFIRAETKALRARAQQGGRQGEGCRNAEHKSLNTMQY